MTISRAGQQRNSSRAHQRHRLRVSAMMLFPLLLLLTTLPLRTHACDEISLQSDYLGDVTFTKLPLSISTLGGYGRAAYVSSESGAHPDAKQHYLYFDVSNPLMGSGRWLINEELGVHDHAIAYVESWAPEPYLHGSIADADTETARWKVVNETSSEWHVDHSLHFVCLDHGGDPSLYFESSRLAPSLSGFYVRQMHEHGSADAPPVYSHVRHELHGDHNAVPLFLYKHGTKWMIGESVGKDACYSFAEADVDTPEELVHADWHFLKRLLKEGEDAPDGATEMGWVVDGGRLYHKSSFPDHEYSNAFEALHFARTIKFIPTGQEYRTLRNGLPMPSMGLGTGGLYPEETYETLATSMRIGYRLFDLAREYNNEATFAEVLEAAATDETLPLRDELFLESKVWPTELGFMPTSEAIETSLGHLNTNYVDLYLLHWPHCDPHVEWMHCDDVVDPHGTWRESWRALERAYAEGRVLAIGVSNFDVALLDELYDMAVVKPHVVQNFAQPGEVDADVRAWCKDHEVLFQPYASIRNLNALPEDVSHALGRIATERSVSPHSVAIRFFLQSGAGVIPRSSKEEHLKENLEAFSYALTPDEMKELGWHEEL